MNKNKFVDLSGGSLSREQTLRFDTAVKSVVAHGRTSQFLDIFAGRGILANQKNLGILNEVNFLLSEAEGLPELYEKFAVRIERRLSALDCCDGHGSPLPNHLNKSNQRRSAKFFQWLEAVPRMILPYRT